MKTKKQTAVAKTVQTTWNKRTYDVWGNKKDGYEVNDTRGHGSIDIRCKVKTHNTGTPQEFQSAGPSDFQLRQAFGVHCKIETDGDDLAIYVKRKSDWYPIGELLCESHDSLSPIREKIEIQNSREK